MAGMSPRSRAFLGIDLGTTNIKVQLVTERGMIVSSGSAPVGITYGADGAAEQDMENIWRGTCAAIKQAVAAGAGSEVAAIGISSQGGALQVLDAAGRCSGPVIGWQDSRGAPWDRGLSDRLGARWFTRHAGRTYCTSAPGQILRLREQGNLPQGFQLGWVGDLVVQRLCGRRAHDATSLSLAGLCNPTSGREDAELLAELGLERPQLPDLLSADHAAGGLLPGIASDLLLPAGIPVGPAVHDQYAAATGCGAVRAGDNMLGAGTAWVLLAISDTAGVPVDGAGLVGRHVVSGIHGHMLAMANGGACLSWVLRTLNLGDKGIVEVDALMSTIPSGCAGLRFLPLLSEEGGHGLRRGSEGRLDGLRLRHTAAHIVRALVEGLACELGRYLAMMAEGGVAVSRLVMCGKAAASSVTPRIIADTAGLPVDCVTIPETSSLGAAVFARSLVEPGTGLVALSDAMKPPVNGIDPGSGMAEARGRLQEYLASCRAMIT
jgi:sugar (pentulose or hexulose) kinase